MTTTPSFDMAIMGCGMRAHWQFTIEQIQALHATRHLFLAPSIPEAIAAFLDMNFDAELIDLGKYRKGGADRTLAFEQMAEEVASCANSNANTAFVTYGHPLVYSSLSHCVLAACRRLGLAPVVFSGVSSIDEILSLLEIDIAQRAIQIINSDVLLYDISQLNIYSDVIVMRIGCMGVSLFHNSYESFQGSKDMRAYRGLQGLLEEKYSPDHPIMLIHVDYSQAMSAPLPKRSMRQFIHNCKLSELSSVAWSLHTCHTLYIPSSRSC